MDFALSILCWCVAAIVVVLCSSAFAMRKFSDDVEHRRPTASVELRVSADAVDDEGGSRRRGGLRNAFRLSASYLPSDALRPALGLFVCSLVALSSIVAWAAFSASASAVDFVKLTGAYLGLLAASIIDAKTRTIPNAIPIALVALGVACFVWEYLFTEEATGYLVSSLLGGFVCFVALGIANKASRGGVGMGDVKIVSSLGLLCGLYFVLYVLLFSLVVCAITALVLMAVKRRKKNDSLPFAPFLFFGYIIAVFVSLA